MLDYCKDEQPVDFDLSEVKLNLEDDAIFRMPYKADGTEATVSVRAFHRMICQSIVHWSLPLDWLLFARWEGFEFLALHQDYLR